MSKLCGASEVIPDLILFYFGASEVISVASEITLVPKITQKPPNFKRLLVPKRAHLHWAQDQGVQ